MRGQPSKCANCDTDFVKKRFDQLFCTKACTEAAWHKHKRQASRSVVQRQCKICEKDFDVRGRGKSNQRYCSSDCAREGNRQTRRAFVKRNPGYRAPNAKPDTRKRRNLTKLARLQRAYPDLPSACEACGEDRVLDIAHKPEFARFGARPSMENMQRHMFWILCPTCHALVDRLGYTEEQLGLRCEAEAA